jgi:DNA end-binding protein Ku
MAARAIWKGELKISSTKVPVKLYAALKDQSVRFHILEERSKKRVKQHMINPDSGEEVARPEIQKGFEVEPGKFVILTEEDLESVEPEPSREIVVKKFVPAQAIAPEYYDRPYYLGPDGDEASYFALVEALRDKEKEGLAHWVMRKQIYTGALRGEGDYLLLFTLRSSDEVVSAKGLPRPAGRAPDKKELGMAKQLVEMLKGEFDPKDYQDEYRARVTEFVEKKAKGHAPRLHLVKSKRRSTSLGKDLEKSLEALKKPNRAA